MWDAIGAVGTPITLVAFVVAVVATIYRVREQTKIKVINSAQEADRAELIDKSLETYHIQHDNLTRQQKYDLMMRVLQDRASRLKVLAGTSIVIAVLLAGTIIILAAVNQPIVPTDSRGDQTPVPTANKPPIILQELMSFDGIEVLPLTYQVQEDTTWKQDEAQELVRVSSIRNVILEGNLPAFDIHVVIKNPTPQTIQLTLSQDYFTIEDSQGQTAKRIYFCCAAQGIPLDSEQEREVRVVFEDLWSGGYKEDTPDAQFIVRGLFPVTEASWRLPFMMAASR
jgi:hypothetical protein